MADPLILEDALPVYAGDSWAPAPWQRGYLSDPLDEGTFVPYDYSSWAVWRAQWRPDAESATVIELAVDHSDSATGTFSVSATPAQTREMGDSGVFDVQVSNLAGDVVTTLVRGRTAYRGDVTRD